MFNRGRFNNGKFNTVIGSSQSSTVFMVSVMEAKAVATLKLRSSAKGDMALIGSAYGVKHFDGGKIANMDCSFVAEKVNATRKYKCQASSSMEMTSLVTGANTFGLSYLKLLGINLAPGQELVIDTDKMTVEINGQNRIMYLSSDSDFFKLKPGENIIQYTDNMPSRSLQSKVLWKDRWL